MTKRPQIAPHSVAAVPGSPKVAAAHDAQHQDRIHKLERVATDDRVRDLMAMPPAHRRKEPWGGLVVGGVLVSGALPGMLGESAFVKGLPFIVGGGGLVLAWLSFHKVQRLRSKPVTPLVAMVVSSRSESRPTRAGTTARVHLTALEFVDGSRGEFPTDGGVWAQMKSGDCGVAWLHDHHLVDFRAAPAA